MTVGLRAVGQAAVEPGVVGERQDIAAIAAGSEPEDRRDEEDKDREEGLWPGEAGRAVHRHSL
jgi:hypothetical protein